ncbi:hypothetical protein AArcSt11_05660 [Natranaeroarchaeum aerophilus]|uniref:Uncharacterized protein n=1 Tax=Natranaeroarchaeum aerophilus TaxID=2917711 RepID=A0AAE3FQQ9_9EURY|nr:hypothetical protein [Natranaeroarchaeum aerophilus]
MFGLVAMAATLTVIAGMSLMETIQTETEIEQTQQSFDVTSQQLHQAVESGDPQGLPDMDGSAELKTGTTTIEFKRADVDFNEDNYNTAWEETTTPYEININAVEYHVDGTDERFVYEGGGQWRVSNDHTSVQSAPQFRFSYDETLGLDVSLTNVDDSSQISGNDLTAHSEGPGASSIDESELRDVLEHDGTDSGDDIVIEIETEYYQAWEEALDRHSDLDHEDVKYYHDREAGVLRVAIEELAVEQSPTFNIESIDTITPNVEYGDSLEVEVKVKNVGNTEGDTDVDMTIADSASDRESINDLSPGDTETSHFTFKTQGNDTELRDVDGINNKKHQNIDQYDEYEFEIETADDSGTGSFLFSYEWEFLRIEDHSYDAESGVVTADFTNIAGDSRDYDITFLLEGESEDGEVEISEERTLDDVSQLSWEESTYEMDINQSRLPYGEYEYTVDVSDTNFPSAQNNNSDESIASGTFELNAGDGVGTEPGEIVVNEPTDVGVNLIGTEISAEGQDWWGNWQKQWGAVTASAVVGDTRYRFMPDGSVEEIAYDDPHDTGPGEQMEDFNLNTFGTQENVYNFEESIEEGSVSIEATYWTCDNYQYVGSDQYENRGYDHYECTDFGEPITADVTDGDVDPDAGFIMTRDQTRNELPDIEEGFDRQRSVQEVFDDGTEDIELENGELQLGAQDFAFMMEVTMDQTELADEYDHPNGYDGDYSDTFNSDDQTLANQAAWDIAQDYRHTAQSETGDPNFNDVIGYVEVDPGESYVENEDPLHSDPTLDGEQRTVNTETSDVSGGAGDGTGNVDVGVDEIVIS